MSDGVEIKSRHQRAGHLWKLPMSKWVSARPPDRLAAAGPASRRRRAPPPAA